MARPSASALLLYLNLSEHRLTALIYLDYLSDKYSVILENSVYTTEISRYSNSLRLESFTGTGCIIIKGFADAR